MAATKFKQPNPADIARKLLAATSPDPMQYSGYSRASEPDFGSVLHDTGNYCEDLKDEITPGEADEKILNHADDYEGLSALLPKIAQGGIPDKSQRQLLGRTPILIEQIIEWKRLIMASELDGMLAFVKREADTQFKTVTDEEQKMLARLVSPTLQAMPRDESSDAAAQFQRDWEPMINYLEAKQECEILRQGLPLLKELAAALHIRLQEGPRRGRGG